MQTRVQAAVEAGEAAAPTRPRRRKGELRRQILAYIGLALFSILAIAPFYYMILLSLDTKAGYGVLRWPPPLVP